jgi:hypothetical protein
VPENPSLPRRVRAVLRMPGLGVGAAAPLGDSVGETGAVTVVHPSEQEFGEIGDRHHARSPLPVAGHTGSPGDPDSRR